MNGRLGLYTHFTLLGSLYPQVNKTLMVPRSFFFCIQIQSKCKCERLLLYHPSVFGGAIFSSHSSLSFTFSMQFQHPIVLFYFNQLLVHCLRNCGYIYGKPNYWSPWVTVCHPIDESIATFVLTSQFFKSKCNSFRIMQPPCQWFPNTTIKICAEVQEGWMNSPQ